MPIVAVSSVQRSSLQERDSLEVFFSEREKMRPGRVEGVGGNALGGRLAGGEREGGSR